MTKIDVPTAILDVMRNSQVALSVSNPRAQDDPIVAVNESFCRLTGYTAAEVVGRNCRFLQGNIEQKKVREHLKRQMAYGKEAQVILRNFRKSGEAFDNFLFVFPVLGADGDPSFFVGSQFEIPNIDRVPAFREHARILHEDLDQINADSPTAYGALIHCAHLVGVEARTLIMTRLASMP